MPLRDAQHIYDQMDEWFAADKPFFFLLDYKGEKGDICPLDALPQTDIAFTCPLSSSRWQPMPTARELVFEKFPESLHSYERKFDKVVSEIKKGNSYLVNLTCCTPIRTNYNLAELYAGGKSKYKLYYHGQFVHFSPETFLRIHDGTIETFPMKGTIDANLPHAAQTILGNPKETTEQYIITDLLRNDLSMVAKDVAVRRFRYIERLETNQKPLLQVSTHIAGQLTKEYRHRPGSIFSRLLPAGSICGAPKRKTLQIIEQAENHDRGFYTGVWGIFDGKQLDSCVLIRMVEKTAEGLFFKSGGGITAASNLFSEYQEMTDKIYVPIH